MRSGGDLPWAGPDGALRKQKEVKDDPLSNSHRGPIWVDMKTSSFVYLKIKFLGTPHLGSSADLNHINLRSGAGIPLDRTEWVP